MESSPPNILLVIWDACRFDYAKKYAPNLMELAESNLWFERAITPAPWSLPAHASIFTGDYPHEHGRNSLGDNLSGLPLTRKLSRDGYNCYGVSANGFACQRTGFHEGFDEFYYTRGREKYHDALNVSGYALSQIKASSGKAGAAIKTLNAALRHEKPIKSLINIGAVGLGALGVRSKALQRIPHPLFVSDSGYNYTPKTNTSRIKDIIKQESETGEPFFVFTNYMDTHRPYMPSTSHQKEVLGRSLSKNELTRLNNEVANPWQFLTDNAKEEIDDGDVETIQGLYAGEVAKADEHLGQIIQCLDDTSQLDNTLIIVTSDHGENLGEVDEMGRRRMGHEASISGALARVPLVICHPRIASDEISSPFSIKDIYKLITNSEKVWQNTSETVRNFDDVVECQYPAAGGEQLRSKYPEVPKDILDHRISEHSVAGYSGLHRLVVETTNHTWAWRDDHDISPDCSPDELMETCISHLSLLADDESVDNIDSTRHEQLEALGYM